MLYSFFWVIPRRLKFTCRRFGTHCSIFTGGVEKKNSWEKTTKVFIQVKLWLKISLGQSEREGACSYFTLIIRLPFLTFPLTQVFKLSSGNVI